METAGTAPLKKLSINALRARVYIYIQQLSSFRVPGSRFNDLTSLLAIFNTLLWVYATFVSRENGQNTKILEVRHFRNDAKMAADGY